jgi:hypothetical protein
MRREVKGRPVRALSKLHVSPEFQTSLFRLDPPDDIVPCLGNVKGVGVPADAEAAVGGLSALAHGQVNVSNNETIRVDHDDAARTAKGNVRRFAADPLINRLHSGRRCRFWGEIWWALETNASQVRYHGKAFKERETEPDFTPDDAKGKPIHLEVALSVSLLYSVSIEAGIDLCAIGVGSF